MVYQSQILDATFGALSDPTRREIISRLSSGERTIGELAARFTMSLPAVSKHVRVLERAGLASVRRDGRVRRTMLTAKPMRQAAAWIDQYRRYWELQFDQLTKYLEGTVHSHPEETHRWEPPRSLPPKRSKSDARSRRRATASSTPGPVRKKSAGGPGRAR